MAWPVATPQFPPPLELGEDELQLKLEFAEYLARHPGKVREAAYMVFRHDRDAAGNRYFGRALQAMVWEADPIVQEEIERIRADMKTNPEGLPSELQIQLAAWQIATDPNEDAKDRLAAIKLHANLRGIQTEAAPVTNLNVDNRVQTVMAIPPEMSIDEWKRVSAERRALKQVGNVRAA
jgi:hypothetical protein